MADAAIRTVEGEPAGCPLDPLLNLLALKWLVHIVWFLGRKESLRFAELQRQLPGRASAKVLSSRLKQLESLNLVEREQKAVKPPHVIYRLTAYGRTIDDLLLDIELRARQLSLPLVPPPSSTELSPSGRDRGSALRPRPGKPSL
jgi:DNA-binding HxlR family transcriptional regulator